MDYLQLDKRHILIELFGTKNDITMRNFEKINLLVC